MENVCYATERVLHVCNGRKVFQRTAYDYIVHNDKYLYKYLSPKAYIDVVANRTL
jgi:hypothetical protein